MRCTGDVMAKDELDEDPVVGKELTKTTATLTDMLKFTALVLKRLGLTDEMAADACAFAMSRLKGEQLFRAILREETEPKREEKGDA